MRLFEKVRNAEQKGVKAVRQGMARAREEWGDVERRLRQRMRVYPQKLKKGMAATAGPPAELTPDVPRQEPPLETEESPRPIVSVHGRDVKDDELDHPAA